jgi:invasion protein IalB
LLHRNKTRRKTITVSRLIRRVRSGLGPVGLVIPLFLGAIPATAQLGDAVRPGATHQDWQILCEDTPAGESCFITQAAADQDGEPIMQVSIGFLEGERAMVIYLPLGLDLRPGILFQVGEGTQREFPFQTCLPSGCRVLARVDAELLAAMRAGTVYRIGVKTLGSDRVGVIEGSLMGFTAGFNAISK